MAQQTFRAATLVLGLTACFVNSGCAAPDDALLASSESGFTEFVCTATSVTAEHPRAYFAPYDPVEQEALCVLDQAQHEVVVAHYNIRRDSYLDKLVELSRRGVDVKVAVDKTNAFKSYNLGDDYLEEQGIDIVRVKPSGGGSLMHLKVAVIDSDFVMTGSFNWNGTAALANDENMLVMRSEQIAQRYRNQVLEVRGDQPHKIEGGAITDQVALHFSPEEKLDQVLVKQIGKANSTIDMAMFTFTSKPVANALVAAIDRGVRVRAVVENKQTGNTTADEKIEQAGALLIRGANTIGQYSAMHQKYAIIDAAMVITGATNWTYKGTRKNDEDLLLLELPQITAAYQRNFADLLYVYAGIDDPDVPHGSEAGVLFNAIHGETEWGDRLVVTGNHASLGNWNPWAGIELETSTSLFPSWTGRAKLPAGMQLEYKFVTITPAGFINWEPGANRIATVPVGGRALVTSGPFGDTSDNWTPLD